MHHAVGNCILTPIFIYFVIIEKRGGIREFLVNVCISRTNYMGLITWRISARGEILLRLHDELQPRLKYWPSWFLENKITAQVQAHYSARAEIPFRLNKNFSDFQPGLNCALG